MAALIAPLIWNYTSRSIDGLVTLALELTEVERSERPPVDGANSIATLVGHTLANAEDNLLGTLAGRSVVYDRERDFEAPITDASAIAARWNTLRERVTVEVATIDDATLLAPREHPRRGTVTGLDVLIVVVRHAAEHLAHAELTRDWLRSRQGR